MLARAIQSPTQPPFLPYYPSDDEDESLYGKEEKGEKEQLPEGGAVESKTFETAVQWLKDCPRNTVVLTIPESIIHGEDIRKYNLFGEMLGEGFESCQHKFETISWIR